MMRGNGFYYVLVGATLIHFASAPALCVAPSFRGLADGGPFYPSVATGISANGAVVTGTGRRGNITEAYRWMSGPGFTGLGDLPGGATHSAADGISGDGNVITGTSLTDPGVTAIRWTAGTGMTSMGDLPGGIWLSRSRSASFNGSVIVGESASAASNLQVEAFRWTSGGGMVGLGFLPGGEHNSRAFDVSDDGLIIVGLSDLPTGTEAFRWTQAGGMVGIGDLPGGPHISEAHAISGNGQVIVGHSYTDQFDVQAFRWTVGGGMVSLGDLPGGGLEAFATNVSYDGNTIVGHGSTSSGERAFVWDPVNGMRNLQDMLVDDFGLDLTGWELRRALGVSADGTTIVGWGIHNGGFNQEAWIAQIPEPSAMAMLGIGALAFLTFRSRGSNSKNRRLG